MTTGERLKELRLKYGYSLEQAASHANTSKQNLYKYENGIITNIPGNRIERLAELYHTTPACIMGWSEDRITAEEERLLASYKRAKASNNPAVVALLEALDKVLRLDEQGSGDMRKPLDTI